MDDNNLNDKNNLNTVQDENTETQKHENTHSAGSGQAATQKQEDKKSDTENNNSDQSEIEKLKEELERVTKQNEGHLDGWRRAKADYLNLKKETDKKSRELIQFANAGLILQILPIYENFKTACDHIPEDDQKKDWVVGVGHIKKQFEDFLKSLGLEPIKTVGEKFDHNLHEAVGSEKCEGEDDGVVIKEVKGGFRLYENVLEPAKVVVVKN
ncbi:MAG: nucleotide exchange factor GrpE [bacterium]